jgi:hypothetical protein
MEHPFLVEEYIPTKTLRAPQALREFRTAVPEPESAAALPSFPNLAPSEALLLTPTDAQYEANICPPPIFARNWRRHYVQCARPRMRSP